MDPRPGRSIAAGSTVALQVAEVPRWRPLTSFGGAGGADSVPFRIRGERWRLVYAIHYTGFCSVVSLFFCQGPTAEVVELPGGGRIARFGLGQGTAQKRVIASGPGVYEVRVSPGPDAVSFHVAVEDDY
jgi:hypothetical protein